jgi:N-acetylmuramoyl-L-alanine amidase
MATLSLFLWKSLVVSGLLTAWYMLGLRGKRLHQYNRFFLLLTLAASVTVPLLHFQLFTLPAADATGLAPVSLLVAAANHDNTAIAQQASQAQISWQTIVAAAVGVVSVILLLILSIRILKVRNMWKQYAITQHEDVNLVLTDSPKAPFTFLKYLFWNKSIPLQDEVGKLIFKHELAHIKQGHTYDKLACQVLTCIFWFNPFYWLIQKELSILHEFIADEHAVTDRDTGAFATMLLHSYNKGSYLAPQHYFFSSGVKRRLIMLQNAAKPSFATLRQVIAMPLLAGAVLLFSFGSKSNTGQVDPAKNRIVLLLDAGHGGNDAGQQAGGYTEKEIALRYAKRIKQLAPAYNIEVQLTRDNDENLPSAKRMAMMYKAHPNLLISLHIADEPGTQPAKGDFDIYIAGQNVHAAQSSKYGSAILAAMAQNSVIPGFSFALKNEQPKCGSNTAQNVAAFAKEKEEVYILQQAQVPGMVMVLGNIKNKAGMQQLADDDKLDALCNAVLKGIVDGATKKDGVAANTINLWQGNQAACH